MLPALLIVLTMHGCIQTIRPPLQSDQPLPKHWQSGAPSQINPQVNQSETEVTPLDGWLPSLQDPILEKLVKLALTSNFTLAEQRTLVTQSEQRLITQGAQLYPELNLTSNTSRRRTETSNTTSTSTNLDVGLNVNWELDLWGKLRDTEREANLQLAAQRAQLQFARLELVSNVCSAWYAYLDAHQQLQLFEKRLHNLSQGLEIIETGYRSGINQALDVYLARTDVQQEHARIAAQTQTAAETARTLQVLLGQYPHDQFPQTPALPELHSSISHGLPSDLIARRPDLQVAWLNLLAADANVAIAHKQRFPSLNLTGNLQKSSTVLSELFAGNLAWALVAGVSQPIFNAGRLKAAQTLAQARVAQLEQIYLQQVYTAFAQVENGISAAHALQAQYQAYLKAQQNALFAETLAFEQYQKGLVSYTTVLEAQRRAFDAQTTVISLKNQLLQNRIALHLALGGPFMAQATIVDPQNP